LAREEDRRDTAAARRRVTGRAYAFVTSRSNQTTSGLPSPAARSDSRRCPSGLRTAGAACYQRAEPLDRTLASRSCQATMSRSARLTPAASARARSENGARIEAAVVRVVDPRRTTRPLQGSVGPHSGCGASQCTGREQLMHGGKCFGSAGSERVEAEVTRPSVRTNRRAHRSEARAGGCPCDSQLKSKRDIPRKKTGRSRPHVDPTGAR